MMKVKGVDVSEFNGQVDYSVLSKSGIEFVIIRSGYGSDYPGQQDKYFEKNVRAAETAGIPWGVYHYSYAKSFAGGKSEASHVLRLLGDNIPPYGVWFDMEDETILKGDLVGAATGFCETIEAAGLYVGIYASANWWKKYLTSDTFDRWDKWVAQYNNTLQFGTPGKNVGIWQYTDSLVIGGKKFDANYAYRDYPAITQKKDDTNKGSRVFSQQRNGITKAYGNGHGGVDLGWVSDPNTPVIAHSDGTVTYVQTGYGNSSTATGNASYGNMVKIQHPNGMYTLYAHLSKVLVKTKETVKKGQIIGYMGNTGYSDGSHLHFEVHDNNDKRVDPTPYIDSDLPNLPTSDNKEDNDMDEATVKKIAKEIATQVSEEVSKRIAVEVYTRIQTDLDKAPASSWAQPAIDYVVQNGYMENVNKDGGYGIARPRQALTRQEMAQIIYNGRGADE